MQTFTLQEITKKLGISPSELVKYRQQGDKGIIEFELKASSFKKPARNKTVDVTQDPIFKMESYESDAPADSSLNLDRDLYEQDYPL